MVKKNIAIVCAGYSSEAEISMKTARAVAQWIGEGDRYSPVLVEIRKDGWWAHVASGREAINRDDFSTDSMKFHAAVNAIHGTPGEDGKMAAYFEMIDLPYTGCSSFASALTFDKGWCNEMLLHQGFNVAPHLIHTPHRTVSADEVEERLGWPVFVKPCRAGSSFGISKVDGRDGWDLAMQHATGEDQRIIVEGALRGVEVTCGVYRFDGALRALPLTEIVSHNEYFDYAAKYLGQSDEITPARIDAKLAEQVQSIAVKVYESLELNGICRVDFIIQDQTPYIIEVNTVPGLTNESIIPQQARCAALNLADVFHHQLETITA